MAQPPASMAGRPAIGPVSARRLLRYEIEHMRVRAGATHADIGERLGMSRASFTQISVGKNLPSQPALEVLTGHLGETDRLPRLLELLSVARTRKDRSEVLTTVHDDELARGLEGYATDIDAVDPMAVAVLAQSPAYARAMLVEQAGINPSIDVSALLKLRRYRQSTLTGTHPARLRYVADEMALRRMIGGREVMAEQYDHLIALAHRPNVSFRIVPAKSDGGALAPVGAFCIYRYDDIAVACQETRLAAHYYDQPDDLCQYESIVEMLVALAYDADRSIEVIRRLRAAC